MGGEKNHCGYASCILETGRDVPLLQSIRITEEPLWIRQCILETGRDVPLFHSVRITGVGGEIPAQLIDRFILSECFRDAP